MAAIDDLRRKSISEMSPEEGEKLIKLICLARRTSRTDWKKKDGKKLKFKVPNPSTKNVRELLEILGDRVDPEFPNAHPIKHYLKTESQWQVLCSHLEPMNMEDLKRRVCGIDPRPPELEKDLNSFWFRFAFDAQIAGKCA